MAKSRIQMIIETDLPVATLQNILTDSASRPKPYGQKVKNFFAGCLGGARSATVKFGAVTQSADAVAASVVGTFTGAPSVDDTITVNGVAFTAKASGATGNQFNIGGTVTITATNFVTAFNASASAAASGLMVASSLSGVVTITCLQPGLIGNAIQCSESCSNFAFAASATALSGGTGNLPVLTTCQFSR
jgi:hypothetical protein